VTQLKIKISDIYTQGGKLKTCFIIPGTYTKTNKLRPIYIVVKQQRGEGGKQTMVCSSLENTIRELIKSAGIQAGSSHSGRRSLANLMDRENFDLLLVQRVLRHSDPEMTLSYIDPWQKRIEKAFDYILKGVKQADYPDGIKL